MECEMKEGERRSLYKEIWDSAIGAVDAKDRARLNQMAFDLSNDKRFRNFGLTSAHDLLVTVSIFLAKYDRG